MAIGLPGLGWPWDTGATRPGRRAPLILSTEAPIASEVTRLLNARASEDGDRFMDQLVPLIYDELKDLAAHRLRSERPDHTLQATALVHEAYARLVDVEIDFDSRAHFFALAARTMRRVLVDHARGRAREKRGSDARRVTLDDDLIAVDAAPDQLLDLDAALDRLSEHDPRKARVVELHFFGGLTYAETAAALDISEATVDRDLRMAKAWLATELDPEVPE